MAAQRRLVGESIWGRMLRVVLGLASVVLVLSIAKVSDADAAKLCCSVFPPEPPSSEGTLGEQFVGIGGVAVNVEGNGPGVTPGDIYVVDRGNDRIQQLHETADGGGRRFVRAFGLDVGGLGINVCTVSASCQAGTASGAAGGMSEPIGVAVDQATGNLYVTDNANHRIDIFRADGVFEGAFGWKVDATAPLEELQFCTGVTGCQAGSVGGGAGQFGEIGKESNSAELRSIGHPAVAPAGAPDAGNVLISDSTNNRIDEFIPTLGAGKEVTGISFRRGIGWGVATGAAELQQCGLGGTPPTATCQAGVQGGGLGQFTGRGLTRVAVDSTGSIYAVDLPDEAGFCNNSSTPNRHCHVQKFNAAGTSATEFAPTQLNFIKGSIGEVAASEIAVDPLTGDVYVARPHRELHHEPEVDYQILRFDSIGNLHETYPPAGGIGVTSNTAFGLALDYASGSLYVPSTTGGQRIFLLTDPPATPPAVTTGDANAGSNFSLRTLEGTVNPEGFRVLGCRFEYGTTAEYGTSTPCVPSTLGEGTAPIPVKAETEPLEPATIYHYRLVAENGGSLGLGGDRTFTSDPAPADSCPNAARRAEQGIAALVLPDCMALEMVSPPIKGGQSATSPGVSANGWRVKFLAQAALGEDPTGLIGLAGNTYVASRGSGGWASESTVPAQGFFKVWGSEQQPSFSPDFSRWFGIGASSVEVQQGIGKAYDAGLGGLFTPLSTPMVPLTLDSASGNPPRNVVITSLFQGASADHTHLYFRPGGTGLTYQSGDPSPIGPGAERFDIYLARVGLDGQLALELLSRDHTGKVWGGNCGARLGGIGSAVEPTLPARNGERNQGAISADGTRTYFSARADQSASGICKEANKLRILERQETAEGAEIGVLFSSECTRLAPPCKGEAEANGDDLYQGASADGSKVYFTTNRQLANTDLDGSNAECKTETAVAGCDLYLYDRSRPVGERLVQVSAGEELGTGVHEAGREAKVFNGVTAISGDGSRVYFVAEGVLTDDSNPKGASAQLSKPNLYLWDAGTESIAFIGTLNQADEAGSKSRGGLWGGQGTWRNDAYPVPATGKDGEGQEAGGDGHVLLFESRAELTTEDADGAHLDVYRYDDATAEPPSLECLSCKPGGPDSALADVHNHGELGPGGTDFAEEGRWVSEDGQTAGFLTPEGLVPGDINGANDFYLWRDGALVRLPGKPFVTGANDGPFLSHDGSTVAFTTQSQLLPQDGDTTADVYVARVDGGFQPPPPPKICEPGNNCQPSQGPPSAAPKAESEAPGRGNPPQKPPCRKGKIRRHGRCMARHPHRHHAKKRHSKRHSNANRRAAK